MVEGSGDGPGWDWSHVSRPKVHTSVLVTTSKALVTTSDALVTTSVLVTSLTQ